MIISEEHILQEDLDNITRILLARAHPLHPIIKNMKKLVFAPELNCYLNGHRIQKQTLSSLSLPYRHRQIIHFFF